MIPRWLINLLILWSLLNLINNLLESFCAAISKVRSSRCPCSFNIFLVLHEILFHLRRLLMLFPPLNWHLLLTRRERSCRNKVRIIRIKRIEREEFIFIFTLIIKILLIFLLQISLPFKLTSHRPLLGEILDQLLGNVKKFLWFNLLYSNFRLFLLRLILL